MIIRQGRGPLIILTLILLVLSIVIINVASVSVYLVLTPFTRILSFLSTLVIICLMAVLGSLCNKIKIEDAEEILKRRTIYGIRNRFHWYGDWESFGGGGKEVAIVWEIWPQCRRENPMLVAFEKTPPSEGMFIMSGENIIKVSDDDYNKIKDSQNTINNFLNNY